VAQDPPDKFQERFNNHGIHQALRDALVNVERLLEGAGPAERVELAHLADGLRRIQQLLLTVDALFAGRGPMKEANRAVSEIAAFLQQFKANKDPNLLAQAVEVLEGKSVHRARQNSAHYSWARPNTFLLSN
jgi:hypothetical protein